MNKFKVGANVECLIGVRDYSCFIEGQRVTVLSLPDNNDRMINCRLDGSEMTQYLFPKDLTPITNYERGDKFIVTTSPNGSCFGMGDVITYLHMATAGKSGYFKRDKTGTEQYLYFDKLTPVCTKFYKRDKVIITGCHYHPPLRAHVGKVFEIRDLTSNFIGGSRGRDSTYVYKAICFDECLPYTEELDKTRHGIDCVITVDAFVYPHRIDGQPSLFDMPKYHIAAKVSIELPFEIGDMVRITDFGVYTGKYESTAKITFVYGDGTIRVDIGWANTGTLVTRSFSKGQYERFSAGSMWK